MNNAASPPDTAGDRQPWVRDITRDAVRHYAWGTGDNNPMWLDSEYAQRSPHAGLLAPPCFTYALHETTVAPGFDARQRIYAGVDWVWFDVIRLGTLLTPRAELIDTATNDNGVVQTGQVRYCDQDNRTLAQATTRCVRPEHPVELKSQQPDAKYTDDELTRIERAILSETRRGAEPRWWKDVATGDALGPLTKGPLSIMDIVAWCAGAAGISESTANLSAGGLTAEVASGPQLTAWGAQLLTDWQGDHGFLHRLRVDLAAQPGLGSTTVLQGTVTHRFSAQSHHLAQIQFTASDRNKGNVATGSALVVLPSNRQPVHLPLTTTVDFRETIGEPQAHGH